MNELETNGKKLFKDLSKEEHKNLRKEFNKVVQFRFKIYFWIGIGLLLIALVCSGFALY